VLIRLRVFGPSESREPRPNPSNEGNDDDTQPGNTPARLSPQRSGFQGTWGRLGGAAHGLSRQKLVELVPTLMIDDAETKMRTNAAVRVELKTWVLSPQNSGMQNSGCFRLFVLDLGFSMFVFVVLSDLRD
jgi:hypothetical protein